MDKKRTVDRIKVGEGYMILTKERREDPNYEYYTFDLSIEKGATIDYIYEHDVRSLPEALARVTFWQRWSQQLVLPQVQSARDEGYVPITEVGPECLKISTSFDQSKKFLQKVATGSGALYFWALVGFTIPFWRKKKR